MLRLFTRPAGLITALEDRLFRLLVPVVEETSDCSGSGTDGRYPARAPRHGAHQSSGCSTNRGAAQSALLSARHPRTPTEGKAHCQN